MPGLFKVSINTRVCVCAHTRMHVHVWVFGGGGLRLICLSALELEFSLPQPHVRSRCCSLERFEFTDFGSRRASSTHTRSALCQYYSQSFITHCICRNAVCTDQLSVLLFVLAEILMNPFSHQGFKALSLGFGGNYISS